MKAHKIADDEVWEVRRGGAWAIKHAALSGWQSSAKIKFDIPQLCRERRAGSTNARRWSSTGNGWATAPNGRSARRRQANNKNAYPYAMAEKRAKDRVILKLLNAHGAVYSEARRTTSRHSQRQNPHVTRPEDIVPTVEYDEHGNPVDNIPHGDERITTDAEGEGAGGFCRDAIRNAPHQDAGRSLRSGARRTPTASPPSRRLASDPARPIHRTHERSARTAPSG
jgi:hypothetical protein